MLFATITEKCISLYFKNKTFYEDSIDEHWEVSYGWKQGWFSGKKNERKKNILRYFIGFDEEGKIS